MTIWMYALFGLVSPWVLQITERFAPFPVFQEELVKLVIALSYKRNKGSDLVSASLLGLLFGLSESIFYLLNMVGLGSWGNWWLRLVWTAPMHALTLGVMYEAAKRRLWWLGFILALGIHLGFNRAVGWLGFGIV